MNIGRRTGIALCPINTPQNDAPPLDLVASCATAQVTGVLAGSACERAARTAVGVGAAPLALLRSIAARHPSGLGPERVHHETGREQKQKAEHFVTLLRLEVM